jgi:hypothetical protein
MRCAPSIPLLWLCVAATAVAQPELRLALAPGGELQASWEPDPADSERAAWNLYRGDLAIVGFGGHRGSPYGRCSLPGDARSVQLDGHAALPANFYYLLTSFDDAPLEQDLGEESRGAPRQHDHACRYHTSCPGGGRAVDPAADWSLLHGTLPSAQPPLPIFTATNMDGTLRDESDLLSGPTVMWFYPAAATGG